MIEAILTLFKHKATPYDKWPYLKLCFHTDHSGSVSFGEDEIFDFDTLDGCLTKLAEIDFQKELHTP